MTTIRRYLTVRDVADALNYTPGAIHMQRLRGDAPGSLGFKAGQRVLFDPDDLERWIESRKAQRAGEVQ